MANDGYFSKIQQYGNTKLGQILMCFELQRQLAEDDDDAFAATKKGVGVERGAAAGSPRPTAALPTATRKRRHRVTVTPVAPGLIATAIGQELRGEDVSTIPGLMQPSSQGALTTLHALLSNAMEGEMGCVNRFWGDPYHAILHRCVWFLAKPQLLEADMCPTNKNQVFLAAILQPAPPITSAGRRMRARGALRVLAAKAPLGVAQVARAPRRTSTGVWQDSLGEDDRSIRIVLVKTKFEMLISLPNLGR
jgi:hypothetical protein